MDKNETKPETNPPETRRVLHICGLCLCARATGPEDNLPFTVQDPDVVIEYPHACEDCQKDLYKMPPNLARFGARLWNNIHDRAVDMFGEDADIPHIWAGYMSAALQIWSKICEMNDQQNAIHLIQSLNQRVLNGRSPHMG
jgi:hypothetical protein